MRSLLAITALLALILSGCNGYVVERIQDDGETANPTEFTRPATDQTWQQQQSQSSSSVSINTVPLSAEETLWLESRYDLRVESGDYWYDPWSGAWGYWGGSTAGFLMPNMELGYAPREASGGGTGVLLNGRELHPADLTALQNLLGHINPGAYWLDAQGYFGYEGGPALGNLIFVAQSASAQSGGYHASTYVGNIGSDGQSSYFYDSSTGCSVMSDGGLSC